MAPTLLLMSIFFYVTQQLLSSHYPNTHLILLILSNGYDFILQLSQYLSGLTKVKSFIILDTLIGLPEYVFVPSCGSSFLDTH
jgi:hypothetical protein